jgi:hypothetical protein
MPLDLVPVPEGKVILSMGPVMGQQTARVETTAESAARRLLDNEAARVAFVPHWATCPNAAKHRKGSA